MERDRDDSPEGTALVTRPVAADWLGLRREADHQARQSTMAGIQRIEAWAGAQLGPGQAVQVIDLGAGTGSNQAWLAPRLSLPQRWLLLDHDAQLLEVSTSTEVEQVVDTERSVGSVDQLPELISADSPTVVTCAALLDLLSPREASLIAATVAARGSAALLSLTVTGEVALDPADPLDDQIAAAFDAHQRRDELLGPDAAEAVAARLREHRTAVEVVPTDWVLDSSQPQLLARYLTDRAAAAVEQDEALRQPAEQWVRRRLDQLETGELRVRVGHLDLVCVPQAASPEPAG
ncbi:SAM-dependent methyltransferase [Nesterenkonia sphaerica]|uniref:SAM-dependent methyltransferase n=1 Tax=Nesterenkonia sphaerica TaxID=1804988 RepID=A0A5R9A680_9MICC|nr:SAM-dependent methyltransferase [Nesterenkonia sphaerica]TLP74219.1 SAM-dependent methyltransferase [Nesterenkonia sphaerica]